MKLTSEVINFNPICLNEFIGLSTKTKARAANKIIEAKALVGTRHKVYLRARVTCFRLNR